VTPDDYVQFADQAKIWIALYSALIFTLMGTAFGGIIWLVIQFINGHKHRGDRQEAKVVISTKKLEITAKEIADYRKIKNDLSNFFKGIQETKDNGEDTDARP